MRLRFITLVGLCLTFSFALAQLSQPVAPVKIKVRAALFDRDLNLKPVPRLPLVLRNADDPSAAPVTFQTTLDGVAEIEVPVGNYRLATSKPAELFGKLYSWELEIKVSKADQLIELSNDNAETADAAGRAAHVDELVDKFKKVRDSVVNIWTEHDASSGFLLDASGLVLASESVVRDHTWLAVQYDPQRRLRGEVIVADRNRNVAILRINMDALKDGVVAPVSFDPGALVEGERVFSVDNPTKVRSSKGMVTGLVTKADSKEIITDVKFDGPGAPLFNSSGTAVAYARRKDNKWEVVPLSAISDLITAAKGKAASSAPPSAQLLPPFPQELYPVDALLKRHETKLEKELYNFKLADFTVEFYTPVTAYQFAQERYATQQNWRIKNAKKAQALPPLVEPTHEYDSVLIVHAIPQYKVAFWKSFGDSMGNSRAPTTTRPKTAFGKMILLCGGKEVEPILPGRFPIEAGGNAYVQADQATFRGEYFYTPDAITPACGEVIVKIYPAGDDANPVIKVLDKALVERIHKDFEPYRAAVAKPTAVQ